jgi:monothiol glutaredoxin
VRGQLGHREPLSPDRDTPASSGPDPPSHEPPLVDGGAGRPYELASAVRPFRAAGNLSARAKALEEAIRNRIAEVVEANRVVLFMKGTRNFPQCGFSATVVQILNELVPEYHTVNVLKDPDIREAIKEFSSWPTIPQLYVGGKFVGGCDIVREMYVAGELQTALGVKDEVAAPKLSLTPAAVQAFRQASEGQEGALRLSVSSRFEYELALDEKRSGDYEIDVGGVKVLVDRMSAKRADGVRIDYSSEQGGGFRIDNPNEPARVRSLGPAGLKAMRDAGEAFKLIDVRPAAEHAIARIEGDRLLEDVEQELESLDRGTPLVFYCHHGRRSLSVAERYLSEGFTRVYSLEGGIDGWSNEIDPNVPKY